MFFDISQWNHETWITWRFEFYLSKNSLEFARKSAKTWTKQEILQKTWMKPGMLRYITFQYYIDTTFSKFCAPAILEHIWHLHFSTKISHTKTWRMVILTLTKPGVNLIFWLKKTGNPDLIGTKDSHVFKMLFPCFHFVWSVFRGHYWFAAATNWGNKPHIHHHHYLGNATYIYHSVSII